MPRKSTLKLSRRVVEALAVERGDRVFYDRDLTGFGDVPDLCHIPPILPILQNHTNRRTPTNLPALPKRRALPNRHPVRGGAKHRFETKTRVPKRSAALSRQKSPHRTTLRFAWDCPDIARKPRRAWRLVFRAFLTSARTCQSQSRRRRKALVCSPGDPLGRVPEPCRGRASQTALPQHFFTYGLEIRARILAA